MVDFPVNSGRSDSNGIVIDAAVLHRWGQTALELLMRHQNDIDELNVFPVADSDTATNMYTTLKSATEECDEADSVPLLLDRLAARALVSARGNSGVILAQMIAGLADTWIDETVNAHQFALGLRNAADSAVAAVAQPTAGTILTVAETAATAARKAASLGLMSAVRAAAETAAEAVEATTNQLPALARAGVVDSGGLAFTFILEALVESLGGSNPTGAGDLLHDRRRAKPTPVEPVVRESGSGGFEYEIQYLLDGRPERIEDLRARLGELGDSVVIIGSRASSGDTRTPTFNVHVHANDVGAAIEAGIERGHVRRISVTRFDDALVPAARRDRATITITSETELTGFLERHGSLVSDGGSAEEVLATIHNSGGSEIIMFVDDSRSHEAIRQAVAIARSEGYRIAVVPTGSVMQSIAALAVADPDSGFDDDVIARTETATGCTGIRLALEQDEYVLTGDDGTESSGSDACAMVTDTLDRLARSGAELFTVISAERDTRAAELVRDVRHHMDNHWADREIQWLQSDRLSAVLLVGAD